VLVEAVALGICGTDAEIVAGKYGGAPPGKTRLVLGHESLGRVINPGDSNSFKKGDLVVGIVRPARSWSLLMYVPLWTPQVGIQGLDWLWLFLAAIIDIASIKQRTCGTGRGPACQRTDLSLIFCPCSCSTGLGQEIRFY
jgi:threonine dehydrogenase-like Zn-dependent dehydrogenase